MERMMRRNKAGRHVTFEQFVTMHLPLSPGDQLQLPSGRIAVFEGWHVRAVRNDRRRRSERIGLLAYTDCAQRVELAERLINRLQVVPSTSSAVPSVLPSEACQL